MVSAETATAAGPGSLRPRPNSSKRAWQARREAVCSLVLGLIADRGGEWLYDSLQEVLAELPAELVKDKDALRHVLDWMAAHELIRRFSERGCGDKSLILLDLGRQVLAKGFGVMPQKGSPPADERRLDALRWFGAQTAEIFAPRPKLAKALGVSITSAKKLVTAVRQEGWVDTEGTTLMVRYFVTEAGRKVLKELPDQPVPADWIISPRQLVYQDDKRKELAVIRTSMFLGALYEDPTRCWFDVTGATINAVLPPHARFRDTNAVNRFIRNLERDQLVEQQVNGAHRAWIKLTDQGAAWYEARQRVLKQLRPPKVAPDPALAEVAKLTARVEELEAQLRQTHGILEQLLHSGQAPDAALILTLPRRTAEDDALRA